MFYWRPIVWGVFSFGAKKIKKSWDKNNVEIKLVTFLQKFN